jgi:hypothetical protein
LRTACFMLVSNLDYSATMKTEAMHTSEMLVDSHRNIWRYILEEKIFTVTAVITSNPTILIFLRPVLHH